LPFTFSVSTNASYPTLPEGLSLNAATGQISSARIGAEGSYSPLLVVTDATNTQATVQIAFAICSPCRNDSMQQWPATTRPLL
jgi:hypothetical protein